MALTLEGLVYWTQGNATEAQYVVPRLQLLVTANMNSAVAGSTLTLDHAQFSVSPSLGR